MTNTKIIQTLDAAFEGMRQRKETFVIVSKFDYDSITLLSGGVRGTQNGIRLDLLIEDNNHYIRLFYREQESEKIPFIDSDQKRHAVNYLRYNKCIPTKEELLEARSLANTLGAPAFFGCDFCE